MRFGFRSFFSAAAAVLGARILDFRPRDQSFPFEPPFPAVPRNSKAGAKTPNKRGSNLRLHLGPSDAGRLMRNRTPQPGPVRLTVHDWYRRKHFGTSKRMRNMTDAERTRAHQIIEEVRLGRKV